MASPARQGDKIRCDACPVMCYIAEGKVGACDRYANEGGRIVRCDPLTILHRRVEAGGEIRPFLKSEWDGEILGGDDLGLTSDSSGRRRRAEFASWITSSENPLTARVMVTALDFGLVPQKSGWDMPP